MSIPYRTQRVLNRVATVISALVLLAVIGWLCWVVWLQRYVVYTNVGDGVGVRLDFSQSSNDMTGQRAEPPKAEAKVEIYYNEGADAIDLTHELTTLNGYYITNDYIKSNLSDILLQVERLPAGTPVMIEMKGPFGSFFYNSKLSEAVVSASTDIAAVESLVTKLQSKGFYTIARISSLRDRSFGDTHVSSGLYMLSRAGLWMDEGGMYWLDPTNATTTSWIASVVIELRDLGFDEVLLADFRFPNSDKYIFRDDKAEALKKAASTLMSACSANDFVLSFGVDSPEFALPEGRCRIYLENVNAANLGAQYSKAGFADPEIRMVFLADTGDTRFDEYGVLRNIAVAEEVEARKAG